MWAKEAMLLLALAAHTVEAQRKILSWREASTILQLFRQTAFK